MIKHVFSQQRLYLYLVMYLHSSIVMFSMARLVCLLADIVDLRYVFMYFMELNILLAVAVVTGKVPAITSKV